MAVNCKAMKGAGQTLVQWRLPVKRTPASGVSVRTHSTEEKLSEGEEAAVANEIQPGH